MIEKAKAKLERIIAREGDLNGARREPWYFEMLIEELALQEKAEEETTCYSSRYHIHTKKQGFARNMG